MKLKYHFLHVKEINRGHTSASFIYLKFELETTKNKQTVVANVFVWGPT